MAALNTAPAGSAAGGAGTDRVEHPVAGGPDARLLSATAGEPTTTTAADPTGETDNEASDGDGASNRQRDARLLSRAAAGLVDIQTRTGAAALLGTGMVVPGQQGLVLTNHHVIEHAIDIRVRDIGNDQVYRASVTAINTAHDLALLHLDGATNLAAVTFADSSTVAPGDRVTALGNAEGSNRDPVAAPGRVTALGQAVDAAGDDGTTEHLTGMIEAQAPAAPGDSGGPLLNAAGAVIGVTTAGTNPRGGGADTVVEATTSNTATAWITQATRGR